MLERFVKLRYELIETTIRETGFCTWDSYDLCEGSRSVIEWFLGSHTEDFAAMSPISLSGDRSIELAHRPIGGIAVVLPQNACVYLGLLSGLSALATGNRVVLKVPTECTASGEILNHLTQGLFGTRMQVVATPGRAFMKWALEDESIDMIHFIGGSEVASSYLPLAFDAGKQFLIDGNGNGLVYVSHASSAEQAARDIATGAVRFNGQTCTSTNGVVVHPDRFDAVVRVVKERLAAVAFGDPLNPGNEVGELFSQQAVMDTLGKIERSGGSIAQGGVATDRCMAPTLVVDPDPTSELVREGVFAPVVWIRRGTFADFKDIWRLNRYPLCAGLFSDDAQEQRLASELPRLSRLTVNGDTSLEDPMEPWGAFPPSGNGRVEPWIDRYQRTIQLDVPRERPVQAAVDGAYFLE